jgi:hypothetical protein
MTENENNFDSIVDRIISSSEAITFSHELCFSSEELELFLANWYELIQIYETVYDGQMIHVEIIFNYLNWSTKLSTVWHDENQRTECRQQAEEAVIQLEWSLNEIFKIVERRRYPNGR